MLFFLDLDGVMIPAKGWKSPEILDDGFPAFSSKATITLQNLISEDDTVMLTTSHKSNYSLKEWYSLFKNRSIDIKNIESLPENINNLSRRDEIINWFSVNNIHEGFVIIDDDKSLNALPDYLKSHLILTSPIIGLTEEHLEPIKSVLHKGLQSV